VTVKSIDKIFADTATPGFRRTQKLGGIVNSPMDSDYKVITDDLVHHWNFMSAKLDSEGNPVEDTGFNISGPLLASDIFAAMPLIPESATGYESALALAQARVHNEAWAEAKTVDLNLLVDAAEFGKTMSSFLGAIKTMTTIIKMVVRFSKNPVAFYRDVVRLAKRHRLGTVFKAIDGASSFWLWVRYALRPVLISMSQISEALATEHKGNRYTGRARESGVSGPVTSNGVTQIRESLNATYEAYTLVTWEISAGVMMQMSPNKTMAALHKAGLTNVVGSAVDLTSFSFIVNWFFNVAETAAAFTPTPHLRPLCHWTRGKVIVEKRVQILSIDRRSDYAALYSDRHHQASGGGGGFSIYTEHNWRRPTARRSILPTRRFNFDLSKALDVLAIARNIWRSR
jgi:hypothetical protein